MPSDDLDACQMRVQLRAKDMNPFLGQADSRAFRDAVAGQRESFLKKEMDNEKNDSSRVNVRLRAVIL